METIQKCNVAKRKLRRGNPRKEIDVLDNIVKEYCLKRTQFDPNKPSPNVFVNKLHLRMKVYYKTCSSLSSSPSKY